ncbi:MAG TPA: PAS domain-containing protein, partial [Candidatus Sulfotelmatobacter sp.]|nr:PAS domain-containing protein [Candidatus Sulfotelmatobacter sp.]
VRHPRLRRFYEYWLAKRGERRLPARRDIDPLDFPYVLGNLMLVDVLRDPERFRVRLHGTNLVLRAGYDMTGKPLEELPRPEYRNYVLDRCRGLVVARAPLVLVHDRILDDRLSRYEALWLPFADNGSDVDLLICALIYGETEAAAT